jgi:acetylornithine deacetylase/succinyl-diaminopimelate desuccinylase-like protein
MRSWLIACLLVCPGIILGQSSSTDRNRQREREILTELIQINTSDSAGNTPELAARIARRLEGAGFPKADIRMLGFSPRYQSLVVRYRGRSVGKKPIMLMAHLDVVDARREDWSTDPYRLLEKEGYYYGRGTSDNKGGAAILIANLIRLKEEGFVPDRDLILVLTADEETDGKSIAMLVQQHRELIDADFALNTDGGGGGLKEGTPQVFLVQAAEKIYLTFQLDVRNRGGHSSLPTKDNAIYRLSRALERLAAYDFPVRLNETTREFLRRAARTESGETAADMEALAERNDLGAAARLAAKSPYFNSIIRTTCVATRLLAGHAENALPQLARATVNCRILPDDTEDSVKAVLTSVVADTAVKISITFPAKSGPSSPLRPDVIGPIERLANQYWPGAAVVTEMSTGATDGLYVRSIGIPVYGVGAIFEDINDSRAHGRDERIGVKEFHDAARFWYDLIKALTGERAA